MKKIIEITTLKELIEMSSMSGVGNAMQGGPAVKPNSFYRGDDKRKESIMREELQTEILMRRYIRNKIKKQLWEQKNKEVQTSSRNS